VLILEQYSRASFIDSDSCMHMKNDRVIKKHLTEAVVDVVDWNYCGMWSCSDRFLGT